MTKDEDMELIKAKGLFRQYRIMEKDVFTIQFLAVSSKALIITKCSIDPQIASAYTRLRSLDHRLAEDLFRYKIKAYGCDIWLEFCAGSTPLFDGTTLYLPVDDYNIENQEYGDVNLFLISLPLYPSASELVEGLLVTEFKKAGKKFMESSKSSEEKIKEDPSKKILKRQKDILETIAYQEEQLKKLRVTYPWLEDLTNEQKS